MSQSRSLLLVSQFLSVKTPPRPSAWLMPSPEERDAGKENPSKPEKHAVPLLGVLI